MAPTCKSLRGLAAEGLAGLDFNQRLLFVFLGLTAATIPVSIAAAQAFYAVACLCWLLWLVRARAGICRLPFALPLILCIVTTVVAVLCSGDLLTSAGALKKFVLFLLPFVAFEVLRDIKRVLLLLGSMCLTTALSGFLAFFQYPASTPLHRVSGFLGHWQTFSGQQMMVLLLASAMVLWVSYRSWLYMCTVFVCGAGLLISETRSAWLGAITGLMLLAAARNRMILVGLVVFLAIGFPFLPAQLKERAFSIIDFQMESNAARLNMWATGFRMISAHPLVGIGPNRIGALAYEYGGNPKYEPRFFMHLHNNILQLAAERGIPGLMAWLWLLGRFFADLVGFLRQSKGSAASLHTALIWGCLAALTAVLIAGLMEFNLGDSEVLMMLLMIISCAYALNWKPCPVGRNTAQTIQA